MTISDEPVAQLPAEVDQQLPINYGELVEKAFDKGLEYTGDILTGVLKPVTKAWKNSEEAKAARQRTKVLKTVRERLPGHQDGLDGFLDSGMVLNKTATSSVKEITERFERLSNAHVEAAGSVQRSAKCIESAVASSSKSVSQAADAVKKTSEEFVSEVHGVRLMAKSMCISVAAIAVIMEQLLEEVKQVNRNLGAIREELWRTNVLKSSGGAGSNGFAQVVYNFVAMEANKSQYANDRFFVWHPDTSWHPAFYAMVKKDPLPAAFLGESDCLDKLCIAMKAFRQGMREQGEDPADIGFHVLIPSWYNISLSDPLHFPDEILPLRLVGPKHDGGKPLVSFVLPHQQRGLNLLGVSNTYEERPLDPGTAEGLGIFSIMSSSFGGFVTASFGAEMALAGLAIAGGPLVPLIVVPMVCGGVAGGAYAGWQVKDAIEENLSYDRARVLGSHDLVPLQQYTE